MKGLPLKSILASTLFVLATSAPAHAAIDVDAAKALFKENDCGKCHSPDKTKKGPSLKKISTKYKGKPDGQEKAIKNMTAGQKVKLEDGTEEDHKVILSMVPAALRYLADWLLSHLSPTGPAHAGPFRRLLLPPRGRAPTAKPRSRRAQGRRTPGCLKD